MVRGRGRYRLRRWRGRHSLLWLRLAVRVGDCLRAVRGRRRLLLPRQWQTDRGDGRSSWGFPSAFLWKRTGGNREMLLYGKQATVIALRGRIRKSGGQVPHNGQNRP